MDQLNLTTQKPPEGLTGPPDSPSRVLPTHLPNVRTVFKYLQTQGWKASERLIYKHHEEGKFKPDGSGLYPVKRIDRYARKWLQKVDGTAAPAHDDESPEQSARFAAEIRLRTVQAEIHEEKLRVLRGSYIPRESVEAELAGRLAILRADAEQFVRREASAIRTAYNLPVEAEQEILSRLLDGVENWFARYAEPISFDVPGQRQDDAISPRGVGNDGAEEQIHNNNRDKAHAELDERA